MLYFDLNVDFVVCTVIDSERYNYILKSENVFVLTIFTIVL